LEQINLLRHLGTEEGTTSCPQRVLFAKWMLICGSQNYWTVERFNWWQPV